MRASTEKALTNIINCIAGEHHGIPSVEFMNFVETINELDHLANNNDEEAEALISVVRMFSNVVNFSKNGLKQIAGEAH